MSLFSVLFADVSDAKIVFIIIMLLLIVLDDVIRN